MHSRKNSTVSESEYSPVFELSPGLKPRQHNYLGSKRPRKKSTLFQPFLSKSDSSVERLTSIDRQPIHESALYAAMDTTLTSGAISPFMSQMILMQYNDIQTRRVQAAQRSVVTDALVCASNNNFLVSGLMPIITHTDQTDTGSVSSMSSRTSLSQDGRRSPSPPLCHERLASKSSNNYLHPDSCRASGDSLESMPTVPTDKARIVQMKGKLLTGDEVNYDYVAIKADLHGQDTLVLHTTHPKPKVINDHTISEKTKINSATGLYRTMVGALPSVLDVPNPNDRKLLEKSDSVDSGAINIDELKEDQNVMEPNLLLGNKEKIKTSTPVTLGANVQFSYSPSFEVQMKQSEEKKEEEEEILDNKNSEKYEVFQNSKQKKSNINIVPRSNNKQVSINREIVQEKNVYNSRKTNDLFTQTSLDDSKSKAKTRTLSKSRDSGRKCASSDTLNKSRFGLTDWLSRNLWNRKESHKSSIRSLSTDSGYKQSIDEGTLPQSSKNEDIPLEIVDKPKVLHRKSSNITVESKTKVSTLQIPENIKSKFPRNNRKNAHVNIVDIEKDKFRRYQSPNSELTASNETSKLDQSNDSSFDQNRTIESLSPTSSSREVNIPLFYTTSPLTSPVKKSPTGTVKRSDSVLEKYGDYVIVDEEECDQGTNITGIRPSTKNKVVYFLYPTFLGGVHTYMLLFPSLRPFVAHHISETVHHLILIFGIHM